MPNKPKLLITGGHGQLAWDLIQQAGDFAQLHAPAHHALDITQAKAVAAVIADFMPDIIINTAAYTAVDKAEQETEQATLVNRDGPEILALACAKNNIPLIHLSTDYVFGGDKASPYQENDEPMPINAYGVSKWQGEQAVQNIFDQHIILRVSGVFGVHGQNFVKSILRLAKQQTELAIVADQITCPTPAADIAEVILTITQRILSSQKVSWGIYHYRSGEPISWCDFTRQIIATAAELTELQAEIVKPIATVDYPRPAKRPYYSALAVEKIAQQFAIQSKDRQQGLKKVLEKII